MIFQRKYAIIGLVWGTIIAIVFPLAASRLPPWGGFFIFDVALPILVGHFCMVTIAYGLHLSHGVYPCAIRSSRVPLYSLRFASEILFALEQLG